jgi:hypothetical protein
MVDDRRSEDVDVPDDRRSGDERRAGDERRELFDRRSSVRRLTKDPSK